jgi:hypothetical protein
MPRRSLLIAASALGLCASLPSTVRAADYYVDNAAANASDTGSGSESEPWENAPGMPGWSGSATLEPGDVVYFHSAGTWTSTDGISLLDVTPGVTYDGSAWGSGERAILRAGYDYNKSVVNFIHDHPTEPSIVHGFEIDANGHVTTGVGVNWPWTEGELTGATKRIEDCIVHGVHSESQQGDYEYGIIVSSGLADDAGVGTGNVEILDNTVYDVSRGGINLYPGNTDTLGWVSNVVVRGNVVRDVGTDPSYAGSTIAAKNHVIDSVIEYNVAADPVNGTGIGIGAHELGGYHPPENLRIAHNLVVGHPHAGILIYYEAATSAGTTLEIVGNIIASNTYAGIMFMWGSQENDILIYNNTLVGNTRDSWAGEIALQTSDATFSRLEVVNNLIAAGSEALPFWDETGLVTRHESNLYFRAGGGTLVTTPQGSWDAASLLDYEATALSDDPMFVDASAVPDAFERDGQGAFWPADDGLSVPEESPAVDAGSDLGPDQASSINSVDRPNGAGWDIGAYEWGIPDDGDGGTGDGSDGDGSGDGGGSGDGSDGGGDDGDGTGDDGDGGTDGGTGSGAGSSNGSGCGCRATSVHGSAFALWVLAITRRRRSTT